MPALRDHAKDHGCLTFASNGPIVRGRSYDRERHMWGDYTNRRRGTAGPGRPLARHRRAPIHLGSFAALLALLGVGLAAGAASSALAARAYVIEQRDGHNQSRLTLGPSGLRYETLAPQRAGGKVRSKSATPVQGVIIRYADAQVTLLDPLRKLFQVIALRSAISSYDREVKMLAHAQPSEPSAAPPGSKQAPGKASLKQPKAHLRALALTMRIGGFDARAYLLTQGKLRERLWYDVGLPGPPARVRSLLAQSLGASAPGSIGRALLAHASQIPLRIDEAKGRRWHTVLRTTRIRRSTGVGLLSVPRGYKRHNLIPAGSSGNARTAEVPAEPNRCGVAVVDVIGCATGVASGPISEHPAIWAFYWGPHFAEHTDFVSAVNKGLEDFVGDQFADPDSRNFWGGLSQYGVGQGRFLGYEIDTGQPATGGVWTFLDVEAFTFSHRFGSDAPNYWWRDSDEDPIFAVFVDESEIKTGAWGGYHFFTPSEGILFSFLVHPAIPWFVIKVPGMDSLTHDRTSSAYLAALDTTTERASHEFVEAATDPYPFFSWADPDKEPIWADGELGDICEEKSYPWARSTRVGKGQTAVDTYWSNADNACVPDARPSGQIVFPTGSDQTYNWGAEATFIVRTDDIFDGSVPESRIVWNDDKDGPDIGRGFIFTTHSLSPGLHHIYARITDSQGGVRVTDPITVHIVVQPPHVTITAPINGSEFAADQFINFRGTAFDGAQGDLSTSAVWSVDGKAVGIGASLFKYDINSPGAHTVTLSATNSAGATSSASITVTIGPPSGNPSVQITEPEDESSHAPGELIRFHADVETLGGATVSESGYVWSDDLDGPLGTGKTLEHTLSGSMCVIEEHHVTVTVTDNFSRTAKDTIIVFDGGLC